MKKTNLGLILLAVIMGGILLVVGFIDYAKTKNSALTGAHEYQSPEQNKNFSKYTEKDYLEIAKKRAVAWQQDAKAVGLFTSEGDDKCDPQFAVVFYSASTTDYVQVGVCLGVANLRDFVVESEPYLEISDDFIDSDIIFALARSVAIKEWDLKDIGNLSAQLSAVGSRWVNGLENEKEVWIVDYYGETTKEAVVGWVIIDAHSGEILKNIAPEGYKD